MVFSLILGILHHMNIMDILLSVPPVWRNLYVILFCALVGMGVANLWMYLSERD